MIISAHSRVRKSAALLGALLALAAGGVAASELHAPAVPESLQAPQGYTVSARVFASGVQIYTAVPSASDASQLVWTLAGPEAFLFGADGALVGRHFAYAGPTRPGWISQSGSLVVGARTIAPVTVDPNAIPWLLLDAVHTEGEGLFAETALIQRVNTTGGLAPATPPTHLGEEARIGYTAEYVFYRVQPLPSREAGAPKETRER